MGNTRIAVLGLDALPYWVLETLRDRALAPHLFGDKEIRHALPLVAIPPITPSSWPSIMSGVNPGKHGLFSFFHYDRETYSQKLVTSLDLEHPRIHEMLSYEGIPSFVLNPLPDFPLIPARRAMILSNLFFTPDPISAPKGLHEKYFEGLPWPPRRSPSYYRDYLAGVEALVDDLVGWDVSMVWLNINFPDAIYHKFPETINKPWKMTSLWRKVDSIGKKLREHFDHVLVVSDHGFRMFDYRVNVNDILESHGYLKRSSRETEEVVEQKLMEARRAKTAKMKVPTWMYKIVARLGLEPLARKVFFNYFRPLYKRITGKELVIRSGASIDFANSQACMPFGGAYGVYVKNEELKHKIYNILKEYKGLRVWYANEVYNGPYISRGPDIVVIGDHENGYVLGPARLMGEIYTRTKYPGHDMWGVVIPVKGFNDLNFNGIRSLPNSIVTPIIQCVMGVPVTHVVDNENLLKKICGEMPRKKNYTGRFRVSRNLAFRKNIKQKRR